MRYNDTNGNEWKSADDALGEFLSELPDMTEEEIETVFQFTDRGASAERNLAGIAYGIVYAGMSDTFEGNNYPVPEPTENESN